MAPGQALQLKVETNKSCWLNQFSLFCLFVIPCLQSQLLGLGNFVFHELPSAGLAGWAAWSQLVLCEKWKSSPRIRCFNDNAAPRFIILEKRETDWQPVAWWEVSSLPVCYVLFKFYNLAGSSGPGLPRRTSHQYVKVGWYTEPLLWAS